MKPEMILPSYEDGSSRQADRSRWAKWKVHVRDAQWGRVMEAIKVGADLRGFVHYEPRIERTCG